MRRPLAFVALALSLAACHDWPKPASPQVCGDPCATMVCPDGTACGVSGNCAAACQPIPYPEPYRPAK